MTPAPAKPGLFAVGRGCWQGKSGKEWRDGGKGRRRSKGLWLGSLPPVVCVGYAHGIWRLEGEPAITTTTYDGKMEILWFALHLLWSEPQKRPAEPKRRLVRAIGLHFGKGAQRSWYAPSRPNTCRYNDVPCIRHRNSGLVDLIAGAGSEITMGAAKNNPTTITTVGRGRFSPEQVRQWEVDRCVAFAVAIERLRGWPVHTTNIGDEVVRFQAEDASNRIYDPRGIFTTDRFDDNVALPLVRMRRDRPPSAFKDGYPRLGSRCIGEEGLADLGIFLQKTQIQDAIALIQGNAAYLNFVPERPFPRLPAKALSKYSWKDCSIYAEALSRITGLPAVTMQPIHSAAGDHFHAVVQHPDGLVEDVWGRQSPEAIGRRYEMMRWMFDAQAHRDMIEEAYRVRSEFADDVALAENLIKKYRNRY